MIKKITLGGNKNVSNCIMGISGRQLFWFMAADMIKTGGAIAPF